VQRGHDVTGYTLACFGGAGGQHACLVADALGMRRILIHPYAGVLSAYGMGLADITAMRESTIEATLAEARSAREQLDIAAPFAGTVVSVSVVVGDAVSPGPPVVRLAADDGWEFRTTEVDAAVVPSIAVGGPASVSVDGFPGTEIPCRVTRISGYGEERQGDVLFTVVVEPTGTVPDGIRWNMPATITIGAAR
jgi:hypothetical protein